MEKQDPCSTSLSLALLCYHFYFQMLKCLLGQIRGTQLLESESRGCLEIHIQFRFPEKLFFFFFKFVFWIDVKSRKQPVFQSELPKCPLLISATEVPLRGTHSMVAPACLRYLLPSPCFPKHYLLPSMILPQVIRTTEFMQATHTQGKTEVLAHAS